MVCFLIVISWLGLGPDFSCLSAVFRRLVTLFHITCFAPMGWSAYFEDIPEQHSDIQVNESCSHCQKRTLANLQAILKKDTGVGSSVRTQRCAEPVIWYNVTSRSCAERLVSSLALCTFCSMCITTCRILVLYQFWYFSKVGWHQGQIRRSVQCV